MAVYNIAHQLGSKQRTKDVLLLPEGEKIDFNSFFIPKPIIEGLHSAGFVKPSPIQLKAIPLARCGFDLIVQAKSGTGKTCVFATLALENTLLESSRLQVIILAPTREIAQQIQHVVSTVGRYLKDLKVKTFIGGVPLQEDKKNLVGCQIAVGAPGRLRHLIEERHILTDAVRLVVLDEADKLMEGLFQDDINFIFQFLPESKQVIACSATYTQDLLKFLGNYMQGATHVTPDQDPSPMLIGLRHLVCVEPASQNNLSKLKTKELCLIKILKNVPFLQCLVFSNYHSRAENICNGLKRNGWAASWIAGVQNQTKRTAVMTNMKNLKVRVLVSTDLTARGIDLHSVNLVVNMDVPQDHHTYLHRMGRAGRYGGHGLVITIITEDEVNKFQRLLGKIEGCCASSYVIPDSKPSESLWSCDITKFEQIVGISVDNVRDDIEKYGINGDSDESFDDSEVEECKNFSNIIKVEVDVEDGNKAIECVNHCFNEETAKIKYKIVDFGNLIKIDDSIAKHNISSDSEGNVKENHKNKSMSSNCNRDGDDDDEDDSVDENQNGTQSEEDDHSKFQYQEALSQFGLKLLEHSNNNYASALESYSNLDESLTNFIENKCDVEVNLGKKLLEPTGTIDVEYITKFSKILNNRYNELIISTRNLDTNMIMKWLSEDKTGACLSKVFGNLAQKDNAGNCNYSVGKPKIKDPEYYSRSSSTSSDEDNDDNNGCFPSGDDPTYSKMQFNCVNKNKNEPSQMEINEIDSELNRINLRGSAINDSDKKSCSAENQLEKNDAILKNVEDKNFKKTVLFLRKEEKKEGKKRKQGNNFSSQSSQSSGEISCIGEDKSVFDKCKGKKKKVRINNEDKLRNEKQASVFQTVSNSKKTSKSNAHRNFKENTNLSYDLKEASGSGVYYQLGSENVFYKIDEKCDPHYYSCGTSEENHEVQFCNEFKRQFYKPRHYYQQYPLSNSNVSSLSSAPKDIQRWYDLWYKQTAYLQWCVSYNKRIKSVGAES